MLKTAYVSVLHRLGLTADKYGILRALEQAGEQSRLARWGRSLFAIYRIEQMVQLDLPWWTFSAIERTDAFLRGRRSARIFEYGSGASTVWLARRAASVTSVEHDLRWYEQVKEKLAPYPNAQLLHAAPDPEGCADLSCISEKPGWKGRSFRNYVDTIESVPGLFDLIVIDGRARPACLERALHKIAPDGIILFDNSHRPAYRRAIASAPLRASRTRGLTACLPYPDETTLLQPV